MESLKLEIVTPEKKIFDGDVKSVLLPGADGEFGVLPKHASLVSLLKEGVIDIEHLDGEVESIAIDSGYSEIDEEKVIILAENAVLLKGKTDSELAKAIEEAKKLIESMAGSKIGSAMVASRIETSAKKR